MNVPFDADLIEWMDKVGQALCFEMAGARLAFVQSDEASVLLTDFQKLDTQPMFGGVVQKLATAAASIATASFNKAMVESPRTVLDFPGAGPLELPTFGHFDARVFTVPTQCEAANYFIWRQKDAERNSLQMVAQSHYSHKALLGKGHAELHEMIHEVGDNWDKYPAGWKRGRVVTPHDEPVTVPYVDKRSGEKGEASGIRREWRVSAPPVFTKEPEFLQGLIPVLD